MDQSYARLLDAESVAGLNHVSHLLHALLVGGVRNDGGIGEEEQARVAGQFGGGDVREQPAARQYALLFMEHGSEERVGVDKPLHQQVCLAAPGHSHGGTGSSFVAVGGNDVEEGISRYLAGQVFKIKVFRNKKPGLNKTFSCAAHEGLECGAVGTAHHCHAPPTPHGFERGGKRGKIQNGLHKRIKGIKLYAKIVRQNILSKKNCAFL